MIRNFPSSLLVLCLLAASTLGAMWDKREKRAYAFPEYHPETVWEEIPEDHPYYGYAPCDGCYELYVHYEPCCYNACTYVEDYVPCKKRCLRYVDRFYEVTRYRYVPQYYTVTIMQKEPEYYLVEEAKPCLRRVDQEMYGCVPQYYWKPVCPESCCPEQ